MLDTVTWFHPEWGWVLESPLQWEKHNIWDKVCIILRWFACEKNDPWFNVAVQESQRRWYTPLSITPPGHYEDTDNFTPTAYRKRIHRAISGISDILSETDKVRIIAHSSGAYGTLSSLSDTKLLSLSLFAPAFDISSIWNYSPISRKLVTKYADLNYVRWVDVANILKTYENEDGSEGRTDRWKWYIWEDTKKIQVFHNKKDKIVPYISTEGLFTPFWINIENFWFWKGSNIPNFKKKFLWNIKYHYLLASDMTDLFNAFDPQTQEDSEDPVKHV